MRLHAVAQAPAMSLVEVRPAVAATFRWPRLEILGIGTQAGSDRVLSPGWKSSSIGRPAGVNNTFAGLRSRCRTPWAWACARPSAI